MSDTAIMTLKTMLANLDDAKKYQSLRDVMETLPAPDLAAVFEDLPPEKLPVLPHEREAYAVTLRELQARLK